MSGLKSQQSERRDAWLDALDAHYQRLQREYQELLAVEEAIRKQAGAAPADLREFCALAESNAALKSHLEDLRRQADEAGRQKAAALESELSALRGTPEASDEASFRPGSLRV